MLTVPFYIFCDVWAAALDVEDTDVLLFFVKTEVLLADSSAVLVSLLSLACDANTVVALVFWFATCTWELIDED